MGIVAQVFKAILVVVTFFNMGVIEIAYGASVDKGLFTYEMPAGWQPLSQQQKKLFEGPVDPAKPNGAYYSYEEILENPSEVVSGAGSLIFISHKRRPRYTEQELLFLEKGEVVGASIIDDSNSGALYKFDKELMIVWTERLNQDRCRSNVWFSSAIIPTETGAIRLSLNSPKGLFKENKKAFVFLAKSIVPTPNIVYKPDWENAKRAGKVTTVNIISILLAPFAAVCLYRSLKSLIGEGLSYCKAKQAESDETEKQCSADGQLQFIGDLEN